MKPNKIVQNKVFMFTAFSAGYFVGQYKHGIKPLLLAILFMIVDYFLIKFITNVLKSYKINYKLAEITNFPPTIQEQLDHHDYKK